MFAAWRQFSFEEDSVLSPDGSCKHLLWKLARAELLDPTDPTNIRTRTKTIEYLEVQAAAALRKMHDPRLALSDKLTSQNGTNAVDDSAQAHKDMIGCHATNDALAESVFGTFDMILHRCPGISQEAASGVSQAIRSMALSHGDTCSHRKGSKASKESEKLMEKGHIGYFHALPTHEQEALVELARTTVKELRGIDRDDHATLDEYHKVNHCHTMPHNPMLESTVASSNNHSIVCRRGGRPMRTQSSTHSSRGMRWRSASLSAGVSVA